jgi:dienelactone hydrolase
MFEYFEGNYTWSMAVNLALAMGASIGDIDDVSRPLRAMAGNKDSAAAEKFFDAWAGLGDKVRRQAEADLAKGRKLSAGEKYRRAAIYYVQAERMQAPDFEPRRRAFAAMLDAFAKFKDLTEQNFVRCEVPYQGTSLPALFVPAAGLPKIGKAPCMVHFDGLDVTKEIIYLLGMPQALSRRGISTLVVDNPGVGESLRLRNLNNFPEAELPAGAAFDYLTSRSDVDPNRIGIMAISLGGYHAPRVAAFDSRFACCVAWGAQYDWGATQRARHENKASSLPVPHYWDHVGWVFGVKSIDEIIKVSERISLRGILDRIRCPILVVHGENDRQIPLDFAKRVVAECVNSPKAELHVHTLADGGAEHCSVDNIPVTREAISDWVVETLLTPSKKSAAA